MLVLCAGFLSFQAHTVSYGGFVGGRLDSLGGIDFREANGFAAFLALAITFLGVELLRVSWPKRIVYVLAIGLMMNAMIMTQSRAILLGLLIATPYVLLRAPNGYRKKALIYVLLGSILFFMLADIKFLERMDTVRLGIENKQKEALSRTEFWKASIPMFLDHPLGVGIKNFEKLLPNYGPFKNMDPHNTYVLCYSEMGIFGILLFLIIIVEALLEIRRIRIVVKGTLYEREINLHAFAFGAALIIYLGGYMMTHGILYTEILWILLVMPICLENATKKLLDAKTSPANSRISKHSFLLWKRSSIQSTKGKSP
jgi:O-antigen ligase